MQSIVHLAAQDEQGCLSLVGETNRRTPPLNQKKNFTPTSIPF